MRVHYKCACMTKEAAIDVPDRLPQTDIVKWMEQLVGNCLAFDHGERSPLCRSTKTEYVKIEIEEGADGIGMARPAAN